MRLGAPRKLWTRLQKNGHLEVVKFLRENRAEVCFEWVMDWAAMHGHSEVVNFFKIYIKLISF